MPATTRPKVILALGGGGCKSIAQIGVIRKLQQNDIPIDYVVGTSMGATIGAFYCAGIPLDDIEQMFVDGSIQKAIVPNLTLRVLFRPLTKLTYAVRTKPYAGITDGATYRRFLQKRLPRSFNELHIPLICVTTNLTEGKICKLSEGDLCEAVLASNALPPLFRPVLIHGNLHVDGGIKENLPAGCAQQVCDGLVIAVLTGNSIKREPNDRFKSIKAVVGRITDIVLAAADSRQCKNTDILVRPDINDIPLLTKDLGKIRQALRAGEEAADRVLPKIKELLQNGHSLQALGHI